LIDMDESTTSSAAPWAAPAAAAAAPPRPRLNPQWILPFLGPLVLFVIWDLVVRFGLIKPILLPPPLATLGTLISGLAGGPLLGDFIVTVWRTVQAFFIAAVIGMPLGVLLGSNEKAYRSVE
jgi:NitT/TauT family transport system permease protein